MDINRLNTFLKVVKYGSFTKVAEQEYISQRAISKQITQLENEVGMQLFDRGINKIDLTENGKAFLYSAQDIVNSYTIAMEELDKFKQNQQPSLHIGYFSAFESKLLEKVFYPLMQKIPNLKITFKEESNEHLIRSLDLGILDMVLSIDFGLSPVKDTIGLKCQKIYNDKMLMGISKLNPLSNNLKITTKDLQKETILYYAPENSTFLRESFLTSLFATNHLHIKRVTSIEQMRIQVVTNQAVAFYPKGLIGSESFQDDPYVKYLDIISENQNSILTYDIVCITKKKNNLIDKVIQQFKQL